MLVSIDIRKIYTCLFNGTFLLLSIIIFHVIGFESNNFNGWISICAVLSVLYAFIYLAEFLLLNKKVVSIQFFFVILSLLFHFGHTILYSFAKSYHYISDQFLLIKSASITEHALLFSLTVIVIVSTTIIMFSDESYSKENRTLDLTFIDISYNKFKFIGWIICVVTVPMKAAYIVSGINQVAQNTYVTSVIEGYSGVYLQISNFCVIGFAFLLFGYSYNKSACRLILLLEIVLLMLAMLSGGRIFSVICICILLICYLNIYKIKSVKTFIFIIILALLLLQVITTITSLRQTTNMMLGNVIRSMFDDDNVIDKTLDEFGGTIYTVICTIEQVPSYLHYNLGRSYINSWLLVGFNVNGFLDSITNNVEYTLRFYNKYGFGGSYIGELYYNFGYFGLIFAPLIGVLTAKISDGLTKAIKEKRYIRAGYFIIPSYALLSWVRGYFNAFTRAIVWGSLMIYILSLFPIKEKCDIRSEN